MRSETTQVVIVNNTFIDYKDILLFDKTIKNTLVIASVPYSRFKIIMSNYMALHGIHFPNRNMADECDDYVISKINERNNFYKIIKGSTKEDEQEDLRPCSCNNHDNKQKKRYIVAGYDKCFYCLRLENNYTTKIV